MAFATHMASIISHSLLFLFSFLRKGLQRSYRDYPISLPLGRKRSFLYRYKIFLQTNILSYIRGILIMSIKQCKGVSPVLELIFKNLVYGQQPGNPELTQTYQAC